MVASSNSNLKNWYPNHFVLLTDTSPVLEYQKLKRKKNRVKKKIRNRKKLKWNSTRGNGSVKYEYRFDKKWSRKTNLSRLLQMTLLVLLYCVFKKGSLFTPNFWRCNRLLQIVHMRDSKKV